MMARESCILQAHLSLGIHYRISSSSSPVSCTPSPTQSPLLMFCSQGKLVRRRSPPCAPLSISLTCTVQLSLHSAGFRTSSSVILCLSITPRAKTEAEIEIKFYLFVISLLSRLQSKAQCPVLFTILLYLTILTLLHLKLYQKFPSPRQAKRLQHRPKLIPLPQKFLLVRFHLDLDLLSDHLGCQPVQQESGWPLRCPKHVYWSSHLETPQVSQQFLGSRPDSRSVQLKSLLGVARLCYLNDYQR